MATTYEVFLQNKSQLGNDGGFEPNWMPDFLHPFQADTVEWALLRGRAAALADCGLGKTPMQLVWSENVVRHTNGRVLILTPLAVSAQTIREAEKFGIEAHRSSDGTPQPNITVTNYERLHLFNPDDFAGVVCDECFPSGTLVDTPVGPKGIETLRAGDAILNAAGDDVVAAVKRREVPYAVKVTIQGQGVICSPNHPFFTGRGWRCAQDLEPGDAALQTDTALRMVRGDVPAAAIPGVWPREVLREILLSEMAHESSRALGESAHAGGGGEAGSCPVGLVGSAIANGTSGDGAIAAVEPHGRSGRAREGVEDSAHDGPPTFRTWRQRHGDDEGSGDFDGCFRGWMGSRVELVVGRQDSRLSHALQDRLREQRSASRYRGGWSVTLQPQGAGCEEGRVAGFSRVDGLEILERGHPEVERFRASDGKLYFYDLEGTRHPSFSVAGVLVHNSSILKNFDGVRRAEITEFLRTRPYRLLCTATAAPNDTTELGTTSEALGQMGHMDMLSRFFKNDQNSNHPNRMWAGGGKWRFRGHAEHDFWRWVCSWARAIRKPSDLGYDDGAFVLPELITREHVVSAKIKRDGFLFDLPAITLEEQREERRRTLKERCAQAAELVSGTKRSAVAWCHLNEEGDLLTSMIRGAVQVSGSDPDEAKEEKFLAFADGQARVLVTKPSIAGFGLNWQHCAHQTFFPSHSFEQFYQAVRRSWRFGQKRPVTIDVVTSEGEAGVLANLRRKSEAADLMFARLVEVMNAELKIQNVNTFTKSEELPSWLL